MIRVIRICRKCGAKILSDVPEGLCPRCVLKSALGNFPDASVAGIEAGSTSPKTINAFGERVPPDSSARAAELLGELGDYELLEEIGRGGQGVVFRARQKGLNRIVALKVISFGQWASKVHLRRFRLEAEAAAKLEHPGIVPIHEVGERDGSCYFSMKFVEGGQLDAVVRQAPLSIRQAVQLIAKVARTVHYAHEHGILHRDIKPGNILLDAKGEPHLTDFGLARLVETESSVTQTLDVLGTPSYMAPEQAVGNNSAVSSVTDVYGLGAVFYQLLTGHPPFAGGTTYETIKLVLDTEPRQPRLWNPKVDRDLSTICLECLEKDPKRRYSSALALAEDLERWLKHEPILARHTGIFTRGKKWVQRNPTSALLAGSLMALAAVVGWNIWKSEFIGHPVANGVAVFLGGSLIALAAVVGWSIWKSKFIGHPVANGVAVLPFENLSPDPDNAYFADGIQQEVLTRLAGIAGLKVISRTSTQHYQSKPRNLREIAKQLGVANIVEGSVQKATDQIRVNVQLVNAQTDSHLWADTYDRKMTDIFGVESEIAKRIAESLQAKLTGREEQALAVKPTNNPEAYDAYLRGLAFYARGAYSIDPMLKVIDFYERAVQLDPKFALAWARLSRAHAWPYFSLLDASSARRDAARKALENAQKLQPNSPETLLALGYYQYHVLRDYGPAKTTFERVSKMLPSSSQVPTALGYIARREGHWDESIAYFDQALALDPHNVELLMQAAWTYTVLRQFPTALKLHDRVLDIKPNDPDVMAAKASIYQAQGNLQEAAKLLSEVNAQTPSLFAFLIKMTELRLERNLGETIHLLQARQTQFHFTSEVDKGINQVWLAWTQRLNGDTAGAKVTAAQARNTLEPLCNTQPDNAIFVAQLSIANAVLGEKGAALKEAERAIMLLPSIKDRVWRAVFEENLAVIQMMVGENSRAISTLTRLLQTPYFGWTYGCAKMPVTPALLRLDPHWDPLRADPRFQKLCEEKQK
jgi:TolB-like protein/tRNA A-37 threonylcarbamoyl transferase component Bud32/Tfp pilus assembly protein PilF